MNDRTGKRNFFSIRPWLKKKTPTPKQTILFQSRHRHHVITALPFFAARPDKCVEKKRSKKRVATAIASTGAHCSERCQVALGRVARQKIVTGVKTGCWVVVVVVVVTRPETGGVTTLFITPLHPSRFQDFLCHYCASRGGSRVPKISRGGKIIVMKKSRGSHS